MQLLPAQFPLFSQLYAKSRLPQPPFPILMTTYARVSLSPDQLQVLLKGLILSPDEGSSFTSIRDTPLLENYPVDAPLTPLGQTALMLACSRCNLALMGLFLRRGANVNRRDVQGNSAVHYVLKSRKGNFMMGLELLYNAKSDFRARNQSGEFPLDLLNALYSQEEEIDQYREVVTSYLDNSIRRVTLLLRFRCRSAHRLAWG